MSKILMFAICRQMVRACPMLFMHNMARFLPFAVVVAMLAYPGTPNGLRLAVDEAGKWLATVAGAALAVALVMLGAAAIVKPIVGHHNLRTCPGWLTNPLAASAVLILTAAMLVWPHALARGMARALLGAD